MATLYESRYGARIGEGPLAGFLADPSRFDFSLVHQCAYFLGGTDDWGNGYLILVRASDHDIYDYQRLGLRQPDAYKDAETLYRQIERATIAISDIGGHRSQYHYEVGSNQGSTMLDKVRGTVTLCDANHKGLLANPAYSSNVNRMNIDLKLAGKIPVFAEVNPTLRIGFITGFQGILTAGDVFAPALVHTIVDIVAAIVGLFSGNAGFIQWAVKDDVDAWQNYAATVGAPLKRGQRYGAALEAQSAQNLACIGVRPRGNW